MENTDGQPSGSERRGMQRNVWFPEDVWAAVKGAAHAHGVSAAAYVREAVMARMSYEAGREEAIRSTTTDAPAEGERGGAGA